MQTASMGSLQILSKRIPSIAPTAQRDIFLSIILLRQIQQPIPKLEIIFKFQDFIWPSKQIKKRLVKCAKIGPKNLEIRKIPR